MSKPKKPRGRPPKPAVMFETEKRADGWHLLSVGELTGYKLTTVKIFPKADGDRAQEAARLLNLVADLSNMGKWTQADLTRMRQLLLPGRQRSHDRESVELAAMIFGLSVADLEGES